MDQERKTSETKSKKKWKKPELAVHGKLQDITQGAVGTLVTDQLSDIPA